MADRAPEPPAGGERELLLGWLAFHRDALAAKCDGMSAEQLITMAAPPSDLSLLGLVRHLTEMERVYLVRALEGGELRLIYCTDAAPDGDIVGLTPDLSRASVERWHEERAHADRLLESAGALESTAPLAPELRNQPITSSHRPENGSAVTASSSPAPIST